jgi:hypothetical protein
MPLKYVKKPIVIEAVIWDGNNRKEIYDFCPKAEFNYEFGNSNPKLTLETLEGVMTASIGDYIIKGIKGEYYPCKPDIFLLTYDKY